LRCQNGFSTALFSGEKTAFEGNLPDLPLIPGGSRKIGDIARKG
jgi:hypothetical protein